MKHKYVLGIQEMDTQHEKILELAHQAQDSTLEEIDMQKIIVDLVNYAKFHLEEEEALLRSSRQFDFLEEHIKLHDVFREHAMDIYHRFRSAESEEERRALLHRVAAFCESWLRNHIDIEDRKYVTLVSKPLSR
jgi:hemerythrin-like metal-binding protein